MVRMMVQVETGLQELLIGVGNTGFSPMTNSRRQQKALEMCSRINGL
jgi:hypothetical protein